MLSIFNEKKKSHCATIHQIWVFYKRKQKQNEQIHLNIEFFFLVPMMKNKNSHTHRRFSYLLSVWLLLKRDAKPI